VLSPLQTPHEAAALEAEDRPRARTRMEYLCNPTYRWIVAIILILDFFGFKPWSVTDMHAATVGMHLLY